MRWGRNAIGQRTPRGPRRRRALSACGWTAVVAAGAWCAGAACAAADGIAPGEWKLTETVVMNGQAMPTQMRGRCLSPQQASDTAATFSPEYRTVNSGCERVEFSSTATALRWRIQCTGQMDMDVSGDFVFDTPNHYTGKIVSKGAIAGREVVNSSVAIEGEHVGDCP